MAKTQKAEIGLETLDGRTIRVARWTSGKSKKPPMLFFNGIGANFELAAPLAEKFGDRDFVTFDMPGIGRSPKPTLPYRLWMIARIANQLLDRLGYGKVDVMGISWGGGLAQQFTLQYGSRVNRLILAATSAGILMVPGKPGSLSKMADPRRYTDPDFMLKNFSSIYGGIDTGASDHVGRIIAPTMTGYLFQMLAMAGWTSAPWLPLLQAETLILMGDEDRVVPLINGKFLNSLIPNSRLEVVKGGGHLFLMSEAAPCIGLIRQFLDAGTTEVM